MSKERTSDVPHGAVVAEQNKAAQADTQKMKKAGNDAGVLQRITHNNIIIKHTPLNNLAPSAALNTARRASKQCRKGKKAIVCGNREVARSRHHNVVCLRLRCHSGSEG
jgi:hypothetical protein